MDLIVVAVIHIQLLLFVFFIIFFIVLIANKGICKQNWPDPKKISLRNFAIR